MKNLLISLSALLALSTPALAEMSPARALLDEIETILTEEGGVSNGDFSVRKYNVAQFNVGAAVADYKRMDRDSECSYRIKVGRQAAMEEMKDPSIFNRYVSTEIIARLQELQSKGLLRTVVTALWDGEEGDSEACSNYYFDIYTTDGYVLQMFVSHTD